MKKIKKILELWPFIVATIISWPLNVGWSVVPSLVGWGILSGFWLFIVVEILAGLELTYWRWFWGWLGCNIQKLGPVKKEIEFGKETIDDLKEDHYIHKYYLDPILKRYKRLASPDNTAVRLLKWGGLGMIFLFGIEPFIPGFRVIGAFFCSVTKSRESFIALLIGNFFYVLIVIWQWDKILSFLGH